MTGHRVPRSLLPGSAKWKAMIMRRWAEEVGKPYRKWNRGQHRRPQKGEAAADVALLWWIQRVQPYGYDPADQSWQRGKR